jgi:Flp pilus assembly protein TadG
MMRHRLPILTQLVQRSEGATIVEAAIVLPVLLGMCFAIIETGRAMWMQNSLQDAVDAAARCAVVSSTCATDAQTKSFAVTQVQGFQVASSNFSVAIAACGMRVSANVPFSAQVAGLGPLSLNLTAESCRPYTP